MSNTIILNLEPFNSRLFLNGVILTCIIGFFAVTVTPSVTFVTKADIIEEIQKSLVGEGPSEPIDSIVIGQKRPGLGGKSIDKTKPKVKPLDKKVKPKFNARRR